MSDFTEIYSNNLQPFVNSATRSGNVYPGKCNLPPQQLLLSLFIQIVYLGSHADEAGLRYAGYNAGVHYDQVSLRFHSYIYIPIPYIALLYTPYVHTQVEKMTNSNVLFQTFTGNWVLSTLAPPPPTVPPPGLSPQFGYQISSRISPDMSTRVIIANSKLHHPSDVPSDLPVMPIPVPNAPTTGDHHGGNTTVPRLLPMNRGLNSPHQQQIEHTLDPLACQPPTLRLKFLVNKFKDHDADCTLDNQGSAHTPKEERRVRRQGQSYIHVLFLDAINNSAGLTSVEAIFGQSITYQSLKGVGQTSGFQRRKTTIIIWRLLRSKHAQTVFSHPEHSGKGNGYVGKSCLKEEGGYPQIVIAIPPLFFIISITGSQSIVTPFFLLV